MMAAPHAAVDVSLSCEFPCQNSSSGQDIKKRFNNASSPLKTSAELARPCEILSPEASHQSPSTQQRLPIDTPILPSTAIFPNHSFFVAPDASTSSLDVLYISDTSTAYSDDEDGDMSGSSAADLGVASPSFNSYESPRIKCMDHSDIGLGLGILGIDRKDGSSSFDGLGIVSLHDQGPKWYGRNVQIAYGPWSVNEGLAALTVNESETRSTVARLSDIFLQETFKTFTEDPLHCHTLTTIPEVDEPSQSEIELHSSPSLTRKAIPASLKFLNVIPETEEEVDELASTQQTCLPPLPRLVGSNPRKRPMTSATNRHRVPTRVYANSREYE